MKVHIIGDGNRGHFSVVSRLLWWCFYAILFNELLALKLCSWMWCLRKTNVKRIASCCLPKWVWPCGIVAFHWLAAHVHSGKCDAGWERGLQRIASAVIHYSWVHRVFSKKTLIPDLLNRHTDSATSFERAAHQEKISIFRYTRQLTVTGSSGYVIL